jgi:hypothetical protein
MIKVKEFACQIGKDFIFKALLGHRNNAEKLVEWSKKLKPGASIKKGYAHGLELEFIANGNLPSVLFSLDERKLGEYLKNLGCLTALRLETCGIGFFGPIKGLKDIPSELMVEESENTQLAVYLVSCDSNGRETFDLLHVFNPANKNKVILGRLNITSQEGGIFYTAEELKRAISDSIAETEKEANGPETITMNG